MGFFSSSFAGSCIVVRAKGPPFPLASDLGQRRRQEFRRDSVKVVLKIADTPLGTQRPKSHRKSVCVCTYERRTGMSVYLRMRICN